ncbi:MAG: lectin like domain-containing protein [Synergistaceae bacterium]|jgi:C1A family cysteine protease|nr:lectin like domain-containing protein [Synergistaceae bacterium]
MKAFSLFVFFWAGLVFAGSPAWAVRPEPLPVNPEYLDYWGKTEAGERPEGLMPSPIDWNLVRGRRKGSGALRRADAPQPASYDLVASGATPPILNQRNWGTCWAFATIEAIESGLRFADKNNTTEFSELHLAYYTYVEEKTAGGVNPAFERSSLPPDYNPIFDQGGTADRAIAVLSCGTGPLEEKYAPYPADLSSWATYVPNPAPPTGPVNFRLKNAYYFWDDPEEVKGALMEYGGLAFGFGVYDDTMDNESGAVYTPDIRDPNHAVLLVGWDDSYPKEKFKTPPRNDGAWKVQNSWGTDAGEDGYYWISYEDKTIFGDEYALSAAFEMVPAVTGEKIYFHDPLGMSLILPITENRSTTVANAFIAERDEKIVTVGFSTVEDNLDYEVRIYRNIPAGQAPDAGAPSGSAVRCTVKNGGGYVTVDLNAPVTVGKGERFAVAVTFIAPEESARALIPLENNSVPGYGNATQCEGESYLLEDGEWYDVNLDQDIQVGSFCVKALTIPDGDGGSENDSGGGCATGASSLMLLVLAATAVFVIGKAARGRA